MWGIGHERERASRRGPISGRGAIRGYRTLPGLVASNPHELAKRMGGPAGWNGRLYLRIHSWPVDNPFGQMM